MTNLSIIEAIMIDWFGINIRELFSEGSVERKVIDYNEAQNR